MESSMLGVLADAMTPAAASAAVMGGCLPLGPAAVLVPGTGASAEARPSAVMDASKPLPQRAQARMARLDTPQHDLPKFAYKNRTAATSGAVKGPHPAWDPV